MLGVPEAERQQIRHWLDIGLHREPGQMDPTPEGERASMENGVYFYELAEREAQHPGDDMITRLTQVKSTGATATETGLANVEIAGFAGLLGGAGAETVTKLIGNAVDALPQHPDQWQKIVDDPEKIPRCRRGDPPLRAPLPVPGPVLGEGARLRAA